MSTLQRKSDRRLPRSLSTSSRLSSRLPPPFSSDGNVPRETSYHHSVQSERSHNNDDGDGDKDDRDTLYHGQQQQQETSKSPHKLSHSSSLLLKQPSERRTSNISLVRRRESNRSNASLLHRQSSRMSSNDFESKDQPVGVHRQESNRSTTLENTNDNETTNKSTSARNVYCHTHADRMAAVWAWLKKQMYTRVYKSRHAILDDFGKDFYSFCVSNPDRYYIKDENELRHLSGYDLADTTNVLHEHLLFHYHTLKTYLRGTEDYVEYIKNLGRATTSDQILDIVPPAQSPENKTAFLRLEKMWEHEE